MKTPPSWNDLSLFASVARAGSLSAAAEQNKTSVPTLSRRMRALETKIGRALFVHGRAGYQLTADGRALLDRMGPMEAASQGISKWVNESLGPTPVRISAGTWTARRLASNIRDFWNAKAGWVPEFVSSNLVLDLPRREIDIGIRNRRPDQPWLAARRTATIDFAPYAIDESVTGWIAVAGSNTPSSKWLAENSAAQIITRVNDPILGLELARAGVGRIILPCFAGTPAKGIVQCGPVISALRSEEWLVCHQDARHEPPIRQALDAIAHYLSSNAAS